MIDYIQSMPPAPQHSWVEDVSNIAFKIGTLPVRWYSIFIFTGFMLAILIGVLKLWKIYKAPIEPFYWFCMMGIPTAILGARIWSCMLGDAQWSSFFNFSGGGLGIEGGVVLTVLLACWWFPFILKKPKYQIRDTLGKPEQVRVVSMWLYADAVVPAILIGQIVGRWGNYFNQELFGSPITNEGLATFFSHWLPYLYVDGRFETTGWVQPLFLYEGILNFVGLLIIFVGMEFVRIKKAGDLALLYFLWYGIVRLCLEPLRNIAFHYPNTDIMSGIWVGAAVSLLIMNHTLFPKTRNYRVKYIIFIGWYNSVLLQMLQSQLKRKNKKIEYLTNRNDSLAKIKIDALKETVRSLSIKCNNQKEKYKNIRLNFQRRPNEMLYYRGQ